MLAQLSQFPQSQWGCFHMFDKPRDTPMPCPTPTCTREPNSSLCPTLHPPDPQLVPVLRPDYLHLWSGSLLRENLASLPFSGWGGWRRAQASLSFGDRGSPYSSFRGTVLLLIVQLIRMRLTVRASCQAEQHPGLVETWEGRCFEAGRAFSCASTPHGNPPQILSTPHPPDADLLQSWDVCCHYYH